MKFTLFLLAAMFGAVCGAHIGAEVRGVGGDRCSEDVQESLYDECVVDEAAAKGVDVHHTRHLELRGNRELLASGVCGACKGENTSRVWCMTWCSRRRRHLTTADEHVHTERFLYTQGEIEQAANKCLDGKIEEGYTCLGNPEDLTIKIFLSEE
jgi:hypothetical protein